MFKQTQRKHTQCHKIKRYAFNYKNFTLRSEETYCYKIKQLSFTYRNYLFTG